MFRLADKALGGQLREKILRWRAAGVSLRSIQALLTEDLGIKPALETVRQWVRVSEGLAEDNGDESTAA